MNETNVTKILTENKTETIAQVFTPVEGKVSITIGAVGAGILFVLCFCGIDVLSGISSLLFFNGMSLMLYFVLNRLKLIKNKKAFFLAVPIFLLSLCNAYFEYSYYNTFNSVGFFVLFTLMTLYATKGSADKHMFLSLALNDCFSGTVQVAKSYKATKTDGIKKALTGIAFSIPVLVLIAALLASGDEAFSKAFASFFDIWNFNIASLIWKIMVFCGIGAYFCGFYLFTTSQKTPKPFAIPKTDPTVSVSFLTR